MFHDPEAINPNIGGGNIYIKDPDSINPSMGMGGDFCLNMKKALRALPQIHSSALPSYLVSGLGMLRVWV